VSSNDGSAEAVRAATADDAEAIVELYTLADIAALGEPNTTIDEISSDLEAVTIRSAVLPAEDGRLIGHAWIDYQDGHSKSWGDLEIRPGVGRPVAEAMLGWLLDTSRELAPGLPLHAFTDSSHTIKRAVYEAAGGQVIREFCRMQIDLDQPITAPILGPGVAIRPVERTDADLHAAHQIQDKSFADHFGHEPETYDNWLGFTADGSMADLTMWWFATVDGEPAAVLYGNTLPNAGYIDTLGTLREFRGRGLGRALMLTAFADFARRGLPKAVLGVDATNPTGARELYESLGMHAAHVGLRYELHP
jgi:mycothiol synthase